MWKYINYEVCGRSHLKTSSPCQDKTISKNVNGVYIVALADGAGSAKLSHVGAEVVTGSICDYISENFSSVISNPDGKQVKMDMLGYLLKKLSSKCNEISCELKDVASTLLTVAVKDDKFIIIHIGDGVIGYVKNNTLKVASIPENGEFANTTVFVNSKDALSTMKIFKGSLNDVTGFILMSDGTAESFYHKQSKSLAPVLVKMLQRTSLLEQDKMYNLVKDSFDNVIVKNTQDDCSIVLLSRSSCYLNLTLNQKCELLSISTDDLKAAKKRVNRLDEILEAYYSENIKTLKQLSVKVHLKEKYLKRKIDLLKSSGVI